MWPPRSEPPHRVIVYGGDVAALETALALRERCGERCRTLLLSPVRDLPVRVQPAGAPTGDVARFDLAALAAEHGLGFRSDAVVAVDPEAREVRTIGRAWLRYDALVVASGARPRASVPGAATCWGAADSEALEALLDGLRSGTVRRAAFALAPGQRWTLPTYELALTAARRAREEGLAAELVVVTHEREPVELLGRRAREVVASRLAKAGIEFLGGCEAASFDGAVLELRSLPGFEVDWVVAMAAVDGPRLGGLPRDADGFLPVDEQGRVRGAGPIWAAGEVTSFPVREAGLAAQQAHVVAASIAAQAGAGVTAQPFRPTLRGMLRADPAPAAGREGNGHSRLDPEPMWWPPAQLAGEHLGARLREKLALAAPADAEAIPVAVELDGDGRALATAVI